MSDGVAHDVVARVQDKARSLFGDSPDQSIEELWAPGEEIDGYRIERQVGHGGFGQVYKAAEINGGRTVAIKVFHYSSMTKEHFQREYDALQELSQVEGVVDLLRGNNDASGNYFVVTEFIEGIPLNVMLAQEELPERETFDYLEQLVAIICRLHEWRDASHIRQFVHGDIKPNNIIISDAHDNRGRRRITLIDFGIALHVPLEAITEDVNAISYVQPIGMTPGYCAPEVQIERRVTQAGDVFQAALVGYEMLTGEQYWNVAADDRRTAFQRRSRELAFRIPRTLEDVKALLRGQSIKRLVLRQALAWNPEDRFQTAADFASALKHPWRWWLLRFSFVPNGSFAGLFTAFTVAVIALIVAVGSLASTRSELNTTRSELNTTAARNEKLERENKRISKLEEQLAGERDWRGSAYRRYEEVVAAVNDYHGKPAEAGIDNAERLIHDWLRDYENRIHGDRDNIKAQKDLLHVLDLQEWLQTVGRDGRRVSITATALINTRRNIPFTEGVDVRIAVKQNGELIAKSPHTYTVERGQTHTIGWSPDRPLVWRLHDTVEIVLLEEDNEANRARLTRDQLVSDFRSLRMPDKTIVRFELRTEPVSDAEIDWTQPPPR